MAAEPLERVDDRLPPRLLTATLGQSRAAGDRGEEAIKDRHLVGLRVYEPVAQDRLVLFQHQTLAPSSVGCGVLVGAEEKRGAFEDWANACKREIVLEKCEQTVAGSRIGSAEVIDDGWKQLYKGAAGGRHAAVGGRAKRGEVETDAGWEVVVDLEVGALLRAEGGCGVADVVLDADVLVSLLHLLEPHPPV